MGSLRRCARRHGRCGTLRSISAGCGRAARIRFHRRQRLRAGKSTAGFETEAEPGLNVKLTALLTATVTDMLVMKLQRRTAIPGHTGLWRFSENAIGSACGNARFLVSRSVAFAKRNFDPHVKSHPWLPVAQNQYSENTRHKL